MQALPRHIICSLVLVASIGCTEEPGFEPLFNGRDLTGWVNVNGAPSTWAVRDSMIVCSGIPTGVLRTTRHYENFILELEWRHVYEGGNAGLFVYSDPIPVRGQPFTRSIESQIMDGNHGDVFAIQGATMVPDRPHPQGWMRNLPSEERARPFGEWNHYRVESRDGRLTLAVNGKVVSGGSNSVPRRGYICLESEGSEVHFRHIRIRELPSSSPSPEEVAGLDEGYVSLYNGVDLTGWKIDAGVQDFWKASDWRLAYTGVGDSIQNMLQTVQEFGDFEMIVDWRFTDIAGIAEESGEGGIVLRGLETMPVLILRPGPSGYPGGTPSGSTTSMESADRDPGEWNRFMITVRGQTVTVNLNDKTVVDDLYVPELPESGPLGLAGGGLPLQFANLYVKEL